MCQALASILSVMTKKVPLLLVGLVMLSGCLPGEQRGVSGQNYVSSTRPRIEISAKSFQLVGSTYRIIKLEGMGMVGGVPLETNLTYYTEPKAKLLVAHAHVPPGWQWDANPWQTFSVDRTEESLGGIGFHAQTFLTIPYKNALASDEESAAAKEQKIDDRWVVRNFSRRFNNNRSKIIIEYREKLPQGVDKLTALPYGSTDFLPAFAERARKAFTVNKDMVPDTELHHVPLEGVRIRYLGEHFFGTASLYSAWPYR